MPHILGETIYLREYRMADLEALHRWRNIEEITRSVPLYLWPESLEQTRAFLEDQVNNVDPANRKFAICTRANDRYVGHIGYEHLNLRHRNTELGIIIGEPNLFSRGIGTEAIKLFLGVCFEGLALHRVGLTVLRSNSRGIRCYEKCGFKEEGALRDWAYSQGKWHDLVIMGILEDEYRELRKRDPNVG